MISLDPNLRLGLIPDLKRWHARFGELVAHADIVKLSDEDLRAAYGAGADEAAIAKGWLAAGIALVVVTAGPDGARAYHGNETVAVPGRRVAVIDTVGAGDTFHAALLARLDRDGRLARDALLALDADTLRDVLSEAVAAAGLTCTRLGADCRPATTSVGPLLIPVSRCSSVSISAPPASGRPGREAQAVVGSATAPLAVSRPHPAGASRIRRNGGRPWSRPSTS